MRVTIYFILLILVLILGYLVERFGETPNYSNSFVIIVAVIISAISVICLMSDYNKKD